MKPINYLLYSLHTGGKPSTGVLFTGMMLKQSMELSALGERLTRDPSLHAERRLYLCKLSFWLPGFGTLFYVEHRKNRKKNSSQKGQFKGLYDIFLLSHSNEFSQLKKYNLFQITITHLTIIQEYSC